MSSIAPVLKRSHSNNQQDLALPPCKKSKVSVFDAQDENLIPSLDVKSQVVAQERLPLTPVNTPPVSPQKLGTPLNYHKYDGIINEKNRNLRYFPGKPSHTLAPSPTKLGFRILQSNYPQIRSLQRRLETEAETVKIQVNEVEFEVKKEEIGIILDGKKNTFGVHEVTRKDGVKHKCAYPKTGEGVITMTGAKTFELVKSYKSTKPAVSFEEYVAMNIENIPPSNTENT